MRMHAWLFKRLIGVFQQLSFGILRGFLAPLGEWTLVLPTVAGALLVGWIMRHWVGPERHHGVAGIMEAVALSGKRAGQEPVQERKPGCTPITGFLADQYFR